MRYRLLREPLACWLLLLTVSMLRAQDPQRPVQIVDLHGSGLQVAPARSLVWEISGNQLPRPSYVFAILHQVPDDYFFLPENITPLISACDRLVMEIHPEDFASDALYRSSVPLDSTLDRLLPRKDYEALSTFVRDSLSALAAYKLERRYAPALIARQVICDYCLGFKTGQEPVSYEYYLYQAVRKPLKVLSTGWTRHASLESYTLQEQTELLMHTFRQRQAQCETYHAILRAYREQDLDRIWLLAKDAPDLGDNMNRYIDARNREWIKQLMWNMQYESLFIAVHAVQLPGEYGLLHLLRKAGFEVRPVSLTVR